jgi:hypothetical protein
MNKVPFGTSDYPEPDPDAAAQAERDRNFNIGIEAAAVWAAQTAAECQTKEIKAIMNLAAGSIRKLKRKVD